MFKQLTIKNFTLVTLLLCYQPFIVQADGFIAPGDKDKIDQAIKQSEAIKSAEPAAAVCNVPSARYRKKISATFFPLKNSNDIGIVDYYGFEKGIGRELLQRLYASDNFEVKEAEHINLYPNTEIAPFIFHTDSADGTSLLTSIANNLDVQYVISGVIRNLSYTDFSNNVSLPFGLSFNKDLFVAPIKQPNKPKKRNIVIDIYLHDVFTEELIDKRHYSYLVESDSVKPEYAVAFGSEDFFASALGQQFEQILIAQTNAIINTLSCRPYNIRIIDKDKKNIYLNIGSRSRVKTGDILTLYHADKEGKSFYSNSNRKQFGRAESKLRITRVFPAYSIAVSDVEEVINLEKNSAYLLAW